MLSKQIQKEQEVQDLPASCLVLERCLAGNMLRMPVVVLPQSRVYQPVITDDRHMDQYEDAVGDCAVANIVVSQLQSHPSYELMGVER